MRTPGPVLIDAPRQLPLRPPPTTPRPVLTRPDIQAAWRAELSATMAAPARPPVAPVVRHAPAPPPVPAAAPRPAVVPEPIDDYDVRGRMRPGTAIAALLVLAVAIGVGAALAFFGVEVSAPAPIAAPAAAPDPEAPGEPSFVVTPLDVDEAADPEAGERAPDPRASKARKRARPVRRAPKRRPDPDPDPRVRVVDEEVEPVAEDPGFLTLDARPYATVYIDGARVGDTPLIRHALAPGKHRVRLVHASGAERRVLLRIESGETLRRRYGGGR